MLHAFCCWGVVADSLLCSGREGFSSYLNTDIRKELDNMGAFLNMVVDYKKKIGSNAQLMIEPKPREPCKHQYDYDAQTVIGFLHEYGTYTQYDYGAYHSDCACCCRAARSLHDQRGTEPHHSGWP